MPIPTAMVSTLGRTPSRSAAAYAPSVAVTCFVCRPKRTATWSCSPAKVAATRATSARKSFPFHDPTWGRRMATDATPHHALPPDAYVLQALPLQALPDHALPLQALPDHALPRASTSPCSRTGVHVPLESHCMT